jgi:hypothetical protein
MQVFNRNFGEKMNNSKRLCLITVFALIFNSCEHYPVPAFAGVKNVSVRTTLQKYPDLWKYLLAEAVGEGRVGIKAVCCVVRNRERLGYPLGLSGARKRNLEAFVRKCGVSWKLIAREIVSEVFNDNCPDITNGALYFESVDFPLNIIKFDMRYKRCWRYRKHIFYKER